MKFTIDALILWPQNPENKLREIPFKSDKISIIHGISGTGKSSIISIIDYCLGAGKCAIPAGLIRESVSWFGIKVNIRDHIYLIARKTPGKKIASGDFHLAPYSEDASFQPTVTHTEASFKSKFNSLVNLTNLSTGEDEENNGFDGRPSFRDMSAFNFLPQHIVANPYTLFFKADSYQHKEKLKRVMPFALGIIDREYMIKEKERLSLQKQHDDLIKQQTVNKNALASWGFDVDRLWSASIELGLIPFQDSQTIDRKVAALEFINKEFIEGRIASLLSAPNYTYTNERLKLLVQQEEENQKRIDQLRSQIRNYQQLSFRGNSFAQAVKEEKRHIVGFDWLKGSLNPEGECVACGSKTNKLTAVVNNLELQVSRVTSISEVLFENPIADKEIDKLKGDLRKAQDNLQLVRKEKIQLEKIDKSTNDSLSKIYVLIGRVQTTLSSLAKVRNTDDVSEKIKVLADQLKELDRFFRASDRINREAAANTEIGSLIEAYADGFGLERRGDVVLDKQELTLRFDVSGDSRSEYLWEVGSGANWMGYHIATFLALHEYLSHEDRVHLPPFSFLVIDQPSQVYFPSAVSGANDLDSLKNIEDVRKNDVVATRRIFEMLSQAIEKSNNFFQVIVLEHADTTIWGSVSNTHEAACWKEEGDGLIPSSWL
ncbi:DUF3732 domain-containing protein [Pseudomonas frederiksbergensis]|uniref:DUF3732 domain-containing protein n=1 Tax=Pseudomonas cucumis TaxID=2954082 RepID=UPI002185056C|nr:DUF3732 domain-containing protein [Pseudomonas cucumis]URM27146.1 DUF3732 domain-containing protein [Pseudomonas frederiksbergensis]WLG92432.1 DUF3732 domain-containing protein [Pseudomonas cucumis]